MSSVAAYVAVAVGSGMGGVSRYWLSGVVAHHAGETFPWGTLLVNVTGSFVIGVVAGLTVAEGRVLLGPTWRQFLMAGVCGGYTTFSSFSLQTLNMVRDGDWRRAGANMLLSVVLCLVAAWLGSALAMTASRARGV